MIKITEVYFTMTNAQLWAYIRVVNSGNIYEYGNPELSKRGRELHSERFQRLGWGESPSISFSELALFARLCEELERVKPGDEALRSKEVAEILECYERCKSFVIGFAEEENE